MEELREAHFRLLSHTKLDFVRAYAIQTRWEQRLVGITGARGVGKTTVLLQHIKQNYGNNPTALYASLDNFWFAKHSLLHLADTFSKHGGTHLFLDEVHKNPNWAIELKNIYDSYPSLSVAFTGSSMLEILNSSADLSRRAVMHHFQGLSFREYLALETGDDFPTFALNDILMHHEQMAVSIVEKIKPLAHFSTYLKNGYYPFFKQFGDLYSHQVEAVIRMILEVELPLLRGISVGHIIKLKQLLQIISEAAPFIPNASKISDKTGINRNTVLSYLHYLTDAGLTANLFRPNSGISLLQKPEKIFLENTNLAFAMSGNVNVGSLRETFFYNQLRHHHKVNFPQQADFLVDDNLVFEIGGSSKKSKLNQVPHFIAADDIEYGSGNKIPLWLFGFLY